MGLGIYFVISLGLAFALFGVLTALDFDIIAFSRAEQLRHLQDPGRGHDIILLISFALNYVFYIIAAFIAGYASGKIASAMERDPYINAAIIGGIFLILGVFRLIALPENTGFLTMTISLIEVFIIGFIPVFGGHLARNRFEDG